MYVHTRTRINYLFLFPPPHPHKQTKKCTQNQQIKVHVLNVPESTIDLIVWVRMRWKDPRLTWDPTKYDNIDKIWFFIGDGSGGGEASEVWTPDMYLWNQEEPMATMLANTYVTSRSDGTVMWSQPGRLKATCKYKGLQSFPFDDLSCSMEFGSWARSGLYIRPVKLDGTGFSIGG